MPAVTGRYCSSLHKRVRPGMDGSRSRFVGSRGGTRAAGGCEIVVSPNENSPVRQAAVFLAGDIQKISGYKPAIVPRPSGMRAAIHLVTLDDAASVPQGIAKQDLIGKWEAYQVLTTGNAVWLAGSDSRGTA